MQIPQRPRFGSYFTLNALTLQGGVTVAQGQEVADDLKAQVQPSKSKVEPHGMIRFVCLDQDDPKVYQALKAYTHGKTMPNSGVQVFATGMPYISGIQTQQDLANVDLNDDAKMALYDFHQNT